MSEFDDIRPYNDDEVPAVLARLVNDREFLDAIVRWRFKQSGPVFGFALRKLVQSRLAGRVAKIRSVADFQAEIEQYLAKVLDDTVTELTVSGLDALDQSSAYLFISNHRDIAMDPALTNWAIYQHGFSTLRIAIGDNLLTKPFASDLMRLNKSFIVNRSAKAPREKLKAARQLSRYIHQSVMHDGENVWIAQREGRAKDGLDRTNSAIVSMLSLSKDKQQSLGDYIREARVVPVSISYEFDPCDADKARELYAKAEQGEYIKDEHEDVQSIARGITGFKGRVHLSFGTPLDQEFEDSEAVTREIDRQILSHYQLHPSNAIAYELLEGQAPKVPIGAEGACYTQGAFEKQKSEFMSRLNAVPEAHRPYFLASYANPVKDRLLLATSDA